MQLLNVFPVYGLVLLQIAVTALDSIESYQALVQYWGNPDDLLDPSNLVFLLVQNIRPLEDSVREYVS